MVSIFTYRDERKLFTVIGTVIVAAVIALIQLDALKTGKPSPIATAVTSAAYLVQSGVAVVAGALRSAGDTLGNAPRLFANNSELASENRALRAENATLREALAQAPDAAAIARAAAADPGGTVANTIAYDPENLSRIVTIDRGEAAGIRIDAGVIDDDGVVGRVVAVDALESSVLLITDAGSRVPAVVQRGRWWGIATGTNAHLALQYISQDAKLHIGDRVVTGLGRSFRAGLPIGQITRIIHPEGGLYQTAILEPAVAFGRLSRVIVLPH